jgi:hypothetical protein
VGRKVLCTLSVVGGEEVAELQLSLMQCEVHLARKGGRGRGVQLISI